MRRTSIGILLVLAGAALGAAGLLIFNSEMDDLFLIAILFLIFARDIGIGFILGIFMIPDGDLLVVWAGIALSVIGGILLATD